LRWESAWHFAYSAVALLAPGLFPPAFRDSHGQVGLYFEAAAVIAVLVLLGEVLQLRARENTGAPSGRCSRSRRRRRFACALDGRDEEVPLDRIEKGDNLARETGRQGPVDGEVLEAGRAWTSRW